MEGVITGLNCDLFLFVLIDGIEGREGLEGVDEREGIEGLFVVDEVIEEGGERRGGRVGVLNYNRTLHTGKS